MQFTSEQALEAHNDGEPIMMTMEAARKTCQEHGTTLSAFIAETSAQWPAPNGYDAWNVLEWLGY